MRDACCLGSRYHWPRRSTYHVITQHESRSTKDLPCSLSSNSARFPSPPTRSPCCWRFGPRWRSARGRRGARGWTATTSTTPGCMGLLAGLVAARLAHVIVYWDAYRTQLLEIFGFNQRAFLPWPGVIAALAVAGWYVYRHRLPLVKVLDAIAPGVLGRDRDRRCGRAADRAQRGPAGAARRALGGEPVGRAAPPCPALRGVGRVGRGWAGPVDDRARQPARLSGVGRAVRLRVEPVAAGAVPRRRRV